MSLVFKFYFTSSMLNMFRTLIHPSSGCINVRNMLSIEEVKQNLITGDIKLISYSSTITMMHGPIYIRCKVLFVYQF